MESQAEALAQQIRQHKFEVVFRGAVRDIGDDVVAFCVEPRWSGNLVRSNAEGFCNQVERLNVDMNFRPRWH